MVPLHKYEVRVMVVGGGGGGASGHKGAGGSGYVTISTLQVIPGKKFAVTVGKGGKGHKKAWWKEIFWAERMGKRPHSAL